MNNDEHLVKGQDNASNFAGPNRSDIRETSIPDEVTGDVCSNSNGEEFTEHTEGPMLIESEQESEETQDDEESNKIHMSPVIYVILAIVIIRVIIYCFTAYQDRKIKEAWDEIQKNEKIMEQLKRGY